MTKQNLLKLKLASVVIVLVGIGIVGYLKSPKADELADDAIPNYKVPSILWGKVSFRNQPSGPVVISVNGKGVDIKPDGTYFLTTYGSGRFPILFTGKDTDDQYRVNNNTDQFVSLTTGKSVKADFTVDKFVDTALIQSEGELADSPSSPTPTVTASSNPTNSSLSSCPLDSVANLSATKENAIRYTYQLVLCRDADTAGVNGWLGLVNSGKIAVGYLPIEFFKSGEFQDKVKNLSDRDFVTYLYRQLLRREPDSGGLNHWVNVLATGGTREQVFTGFVSSDEFRNLHTIYYLAR